MARFKPVVRRKARFHEPGLTADQMLRVGEALRKSVFDRIRLGQDVNDRAAPPLTQTQRSNSKTVDQQRLYWISKGTRKTYAHYKVVKYGGKPIRDWWRTGRTLRSMKVLRAMKNQVVVGFTDAVSNARAFFNNRRWRQFGVSPRDREALAAAVSVELRGESVGKKVA